jgi:uncharacterized oligopeptide transporter (OPT) family protein
VAEDPRLATPRSIVFALPLLVFSFASPFIGGYLSDLTPDDTVILGAFVAWLLAGLTAGFLGIVCTVIGARRSPRSGLTILTVVLAAILALVVLILFGWLLR